MGKEEHSPVLLRMNRRNIAAVSDVERFGFAFSRAYRVSARAFGITPATAWVDVGDGALDVRFGPWRLSTPLANVTDVAVTGPYAFWKTAGPARLAITDRGLTFATNGDRGVLISFRTPVRGLGPLGVLRHPELTVTVAEVRRLAELLRSSYGEAPTRRSSKRSTM
jgi:hypothetical protein